MQAATPALLDLQRAFRASLLADEGVANFADIVSDGLDPNARVDIYRNTFCSVLTTALRLTYPAVQRLVGADFFDGAARLFIESHPPRSAYLNAYGGEFADFLATFKRAATLQYLPDVARLEWAVNRALHAQDWVRLDPAALNALADADRARVCLEPNPSITLLPVQYPVDAIWRAVLDQDDRALGEIDLTEGRLWLLVERFEGCTRVSRLSERAWQFAGRVFDGTPLAMALDDSKGVDVPLLLADHLASGRFVGFTLANLPST